MTLLNLLTAGEEEIQNFVAEAEKENRTKPLVEGLCKVCNEEGLLRVEAESAPMDDPLIPSHFKERYRGVYSCTCLDCKATQDYSLKEVKFL